jgi:protein-L-isoaspartate(D-aspartate) O-methyltransferase
VVLGLLLTGFSGRMSSGGADAETLRKRMVDRQIAGRGISNERVLEAMRKVPRHLFVPEAVRDRAYEDQPLPIGKGQTISQPYMVAAMTELLDPQPTDVILEVGTGSGYQAAVLSELVTRVYSIEIVPELADTARLALESAGYKNVVVIAGDGYRGLPEHAPFDGIVVTAAPGEIPKPLIEQLKLGGKLVIPVGEVDQWLEVLERNDEGVERKALFPVRFVPMTGEAQDHDDD